MRITLNQFGGTFPKVSPRLLDSRSAVVAVDSKLWSGELRPFYTDVFEKALDSSVKTIFKYKRTDGPAQWLTWANDTVHLVAGPTADDLYNRIFMTGLGDMLCFDTHTLPSNATTVTSSNAVRVAIERPTNRAEMAVSGTGTGNTESRSYVYAYVRKWQDSKIDLGTHSDPAYKAGTTTLTVDVQTGQTVTVTKIKRPTDEVSSAITHIRLYRSVVTSTGDATYRYVCEWPVSGTMPSNVTWNAGTSDFTVTDNLGVLALGEAIESAHWDAPVTGLKGIVSLKNGVLAAFKGNDVYFSEPYQPHAWPQDYRVTLDYDVVGLGCFGNTLVICTTAYPFLCTVSDPASVVAKPVQEVAPCVSADSIRNLNGGVIYASTQGIMLIDSTKPRIITQDMLTRDEWKLYNPQSVRGEYYRGQYFTFCDTTERGTSGFILDVFNSSTGLVELSQSCAASFLDEETDELFVVYKALDDTYNIYKFDSGYGEIRPYRWHSKEFVTNAGYASFAAARVDFADETYKAPSTVVVSGVAAGINMYTNNTFSINGDQFTNAVNVQKVTSYTTFKYYVDGVLKYTYLVPSSKPFRLPSGFVGSIFEVEIISNKAINRIQLASSLSELE